ncbi:MAG: hypothetical protein GXP42_06220 [Chloroflexi bacterium]|nr:hypothetical protein [Chloroflexota bacterium]
MIETRRFGRSFSFAALQARRGRAWLLFVAWAIFFFASSLSAAAGPRPGLHLREANANRVVLELYVSNIQLLPSVNAPGFVRVEAEGLDGQTGKPGAPRLPATSVLVAIPPEGEVRLRVLDDAVTKDFERVRIEPTPLEEPELAPRFQQDPDAFFALDDPQQAYIGTKQRYEYAPDREIAAELNYQPVRLGEIGYLRDQRFVRVLFEPMEYDGAGRLRVHQRLRVALEFDDVAATRTAALPRPDPYFEPLFQRVFINYEQARAWRRPPAKPQALDLNQTNVSQRLRIRVEQEGLYIVTYEDVLATGVNMSKIRPVTFRLTDQNGERAIYVHGEADGRFDPGDYILFYGQKSENRYARERVYWLSWGADDGLRMTTRDVNPNQGGVQVSQYQAVYRGERNEIYFSSLPPAGEAERWYWKRYTVGGRNPIPTLTFDAPLSDVAPGATAALRMVVRGYTADYAINPDHRLQFFINGTQVGVGEWDGQDQLDASYDFDSALLFDGVNEVRLHAPGDTGASLETGYMNWFEITYPRRLVAQDDRLLFNDATTGRRLYEIQGFEQSALEAYDVTDPARPVRLTGFQVDGGAPYRVRFSDDRSPTVAYLVQDERARLRPASVEAAYPTNLRSSGNQADYLIISHAEFLDAIQPLAEYRMSQGYRVMLIDVQSIYDEFGDGSPSPETIREFLRYAYFNWQPPAPAFVLLVGDGTYDPRDYKQTGRKTYIPPMLAVVDPFIKETAADNRMVTVSGDDILPDYYIGRFPVNSPAEVNVMVDKTIQYETAPWPGDWPKRTLFVTDNPDTAGDFPYLSDLVADNLLPTEYDALKQKIYLGVNYSSSIAARNDIVQAFEQGALLTNYVGHGQVTYWAAEFLFRGEDAATLSNGGRLPVHLSMTCLDGRFQEVAIDSLSEQLVRNPNGGAAAVWAATGLGVAHGHDYLHRGFYTALFQEGEAVLGPLLVSGKLELYTGDSLGIYHDLIDTFGLIGDPALRLNLAGSDLSIELESMPSDDVSQGEAVEFRFRLQNRGPLATAYTVVEAELPPLVGLSAQSDLGEVQIQPGPPIRFQLPGLEADQSASLVITGTMPSRVDRAEFGVRASIFSNQKDENPDNSVTPLYWLNVVAADMRADLTLQPGRTLAGGEAFTVSANYENIGPGLANGVLITLTLPSGLQNIQWTATQPGVTLLNADPYVFSAPDLGPGESGSITLSGATFDAVRRDFAQARVHTDWADRNPANNVSEPIPFIIAGRDAFEPNDVRAQAVLSPIPGRLSDLSYHAVGDEDWFYFQAESGARYQFFTDRLTEGGDTQLTLFDADGVELARNDDVGPEQPWSAITWVAPASGRYYLRVTHPTAQASYFLYDLVTSRGFQHYLPLLLAGHQPFRPTPSPTPTSNPTPTPSPTPTPNLPPTPTPTPTFTPTPGPPPPACLPRYKATLPLNGAPLALAAAENRILTSLVDLNAIAMVDAKTGDYLGSHSSAGLSPTAIAVWNGLYFVSNYGDDVVSVFDLANAQLQKRFPAGDRPGSLTVTDGGDLYVANSGSDTVSVYRALSGQPVNKVKIAGSPTFVLAAGDTVWLTRQDGASGLLGLRLGGSVIVVVPDAPPGARRIAQDPVTGFLYVSYPELGKVYVVDPTRLKVIDIIDAPGAPHALMIQASLRTLYVVDVSGDRLLVIDLLTGQLLSQIPVGAQSDALGGQGLVYLDGSLYISNDADRSITVLELPACRK